MNIFFIDNDLKKCAQFHNDFHVRKMIIESAEMLCICNYFYGETNLPYSKRSCRYKYHLNHPCSKWVRESETNWWILFYLMEELNEEYKYRYNRKDDHLTYHKMKNVLPPSMDDKGFTLPALAIKELKHQFDRSNYINAYRKYYQTHKNHLAIWTKRDKPYWY